MNRHIVVIVEVWVAEHRHEQLYFFGFWLVVALVHSNVTGEGCHELLEDSVRSR